jgi:hypothetical protein
MCSCGQKGEAENALQVYADDVLDEVLEAERKEVSQSVIVSEIRLVRRFWPQFGIGVTAGFASAVLFAALLTILAYIVFQDASPIAFGKEMSRQQMEGAANGEATSKPKGNQ